LPALEHRSPQERAALADLVSRRNVARVLDAILRESPVLAGLVQAGRIAVVGAMYDVATGGLEFIPEREVGTSPEAPWQAESRDRPVVGGSGVIA
jgi:carbonic anhydrase/SulP family sulfate permease